MRSIFLLVFITIFSSQSYSQDRGRFYISAFEKYVEPFSTEIEKSGKIQIVESLLHPQALVIYFENQLDSIFSGDSTQRNNYLAHTALIGTLGNVPRISLKRNPKRKNKVFFSWIGYDIFYAELTFGDSRKYNYSERPSFGKSYAFMFLVKNDEVYLVSRKKLDLM